jgi:hypothetical protein
MSDPVQAARAAADAIDAQALGGAMLVSNDLLNEWAKLLRALADDVARLTRERDALRQSNRDFADTLAAANAQLVRVAGERDRLRAALAPFAAMLNNKVAGGGLVSDLKDSEEFVAGVLVCDIRRAVEVLAPPDADAGGGRG